MALDPHHKLDAWEIILYGMGLAFTFEGTLPRMSTQLS